MRQKHSQAVEELAEQLEQAGGCVGPLGPWDSATVGRGGLGPRVSQAPSPLPDCCVQLGPLGSLCALVSSSVREASESPLHAVH